MDNYLSPLASCIKCREVKSSKGLFTHFVRTHGTEEQKSIYKSGFTSGEISAIKRKSFDKKIESLKTYYLNPNVCKLCNLELDWFQRNNKFCSHSCSASSNNEHMKRTESQNIKTALSVKLYHEKRKLEKQEFLNNFVGPIFRKQKREKPIKEPKKLKHKRYEILGDYCKIYFCNCKFCNSTFIKQTVKQICDNCKVDQERLYFDYRFSFNVYNYPDLFDLNKLSELGWYSPRGKSGKWNPEGLSRDHKVSVSESVKNLYDPFYITHPLNCDLIPHTENNKKKHRSSISYQQLVSIVDEYEKLSRSDSN
jgi:hypothetical protein